MVCDVCNKRKANGLNSSNAKNIRISKGGHVLYRETRSFALSMIVSIATIADNIGDATSEGLECWY